jgi:uncharacterized protein (TIGR02453 family)
VPAASRTNHRSRRGPVEPFTPKTLAFLRAIARNNRREWFHARKDRYESDVRAPMVALVERLAIDLPAFAPDHAADPRTSIYRPWRDTRFSNDKAPIKTNIAAVFPHRLLPKHAGAGFYLEVAPRHVWYGGGIYMPTTGQLQLIREHIARHHRKLAAIVNAPAFKRTFGAISGDQLVRVPRGYAQDHPAANFLRYRQFLAACEAPAEFAVEPGFYRALLASWKALAPLLHFLNEPLLTALRTPPSGREWLDSGW